ncbi:hypothetical protein [Roseixanthobacter glucoisosaccharinicivorans]|uniref:hypothetical protein n=1 Tax=Roseixanthobacter glucoisosaccharinicivorans TaxID=3119923 RepID=UPI0037288B6D
MDDGLRRQKGGRLVGLGRDLAEIPTISIKRKQPANLAFPFPQHRIYRDRAVAILTSLDLPCDLDADIGEQGIANVRGTAATPRHRTRHTHAAEDARSR